MRENGSHIKLNKNEHLTLKSLIVPFWFCQLLQFFLYFLCIKFFIRQNVEICEYNTNNTNNSNDTNNSTNNDTNNIKITLH